MAKCVYALNILKCAHVFICVHVLLVIGSNTYSMHFIDHMTIRNKRTITEGQEWCYEEITWHK